MDRRRTVLAVLASTALALLIVPAALAATFGQGQTYTLAAGEVVEDDLYAFAETVVIEGTVDGDVVAAGTTVTIAPTGVVRGDLIAAGQGVLVKGTVEDDVRAAAFTVQLEEGGRVGGDFVAAGFSVGLSNGATVEGDVLGAGVQGLVDGQVGGDLTFGGSGLEITGSVEGDVTADVEAPGEGGPPMFAFPFITAQPPRSIGSGLKVADSARIGGDLNYTSPATASVPEEVVGGETAHETTARPAEAVEAPPPPETASDRALGWIVTVLQDYVSLLIAGLILVWLGARLSGAVTAFLADRWLPSFGSGCLTVIVASILAFAIPVATLALGLFLAAIKLGPLAKPILALGLLAGVASTAGLYLLTWLGTVFVAICLGTWILDRLAPAQSGSRWVPLLLGLVLVVIAFNLPYIGFLMKVLIATAGLGGLVLWLWRTWSPGGGSTEPQWSEAA